MMFNYDDTVRQDAEPDGIDYLKKEISYSYEEDSSLIHPYAVTLDWSKGSETLKTVLAPNSTVA